MTSAAPAPSPTVPAGSSLYYASLFLAPAQRNALAAFHAFCREIESVVDDVSDPSVAQTKLNWWRQQVAQSWPPAARRPEHPLLQTLAQQAPAFQIESRHLLQVIDGYQMDLDQSRYLDQAALQRYCHLVAGVAGEVTARIFGQTDDRTTEHAHRLGQAIQLTLILRDLGQDTARGRIYLPIDDLQRFDVKAHELLKRGQASDASFRQRFEALMRSQIERAEQTYDEALALLPAADRRTQKPALMLASMHRALLREMAADPHLVLTQRISLPPLRLLWLAWKVQALGRL